jgi:hypothetical protein
MPVILKHIDIGCRISVSQVRNAAPTRQANQYYIHELFPAQPVLLVTPSFNPFDVSWSYEQLLRQLKIECCSTAT